MTVYQSRRPNVQEDLIPRMQIIKFLQLITRFVTPIMTCEGRHCVVGILCVGTVTNIPGDRCVPDVLKFLTAD